ncbi:SDR family oxidoreductase [Micromonospora sp. NBC_00898]|uniref:SDR family oxidoreductase n=1 Tax=Micromonospora sp. NBC_00898 TaxID=2975981 RepID=UPI003869F81F|nr:SDR family oxidoreductase [Micromonospora sp. NBC_00898]
MRQTREPSAAFALHGRRALVTGAATGIGRAIALAYASAGADLVLLSDQDNLDDVAGLAQALGAKVACVRFDLADAAGRPGFVEALLDHHDVDILVNNAGLIRRGPSETFADDDWYDVIEVNTHAAFQLARAAGRRMLGRGGGKIINVASVLSFQGGMFVPSYAASKHALAGLTRALANEWAGRGVNVNAIAPGYVETAVTEDLRDDQRRRAEITARIPAGRWATPQDIAGPAVFLASAAADYIHGHILVVDGGWLCR